MARASTLPQPALRGDVVLVLYAVGWLLVVLALAMLVPAAVDAAQGEPEWRAFVGSAAITLFFGDPAGPVLPRAAPGAAGPHGLPADQPDLAGRHAVRFAAVPDRRGQPVVHRRRVRDDVGDHDHRLDGDRRPRPGAARAPAVAIPAAALGGHRDRPDQRRHAAVPAHRRHAAVPQRVVGPLRQAAAEHARPDGPDPAASTWSWSPPARSSWTPSAWSFFDAFNHACTAVSTGGFSTRDSSVGGFQNPAVEWVITLFMIAGALPMVRFVALAQGRSDLFLGDSQIRLFLAFVLIATALLAGWLVVALGPPRPRGVAAGHVQRRLGHDDHRVRDGRLPALGRPRDRAVPGAHRVRRLHRLDHRRDQDVPLRDPLAVRPPLRHEPVPAQPRGAPALRGAARSTPRSSTAS